MLRTANLWVDQWECSDQYYVHLSTWTQPVPNPGQYFIALTWKAFFIQLPWPEHQDQVRFFKPGGRGRFGTQQKNLSRILVLSSSGWRAPLTNGLNYREFECVLFSWTESMQLWNNPILKVCCPYAVKAESFHELQTPDRFMWSHTPTWKVDIHNLWKDSFESEIDVLAVKI